MGLTHVAKVCAFTWAIIGCFVHPKWMANLLNVSVDFICDCRIDHVFLSMHIGYRAYIMQYRMCTCVRNMHIHMGRPSVFYAFEVDGDIQNTTKEG